MLWGGPTTTLISTLLAICPIVPTPVVTTGLVPTPLMTTILAPTALIATPRVATVRSQNSTNVFIKCGNAVTNDGDAERTTTAIGMRRRAYSTRP